MRTPEEILALIRPVCKHADPVPDPTLTPKGFKIHADDLRGVCHELHRNSILYFDMLSCLTAIDNGAAVGTMDVVYNLYSIPFNHHIALKVVLPRQNAELDSIQDIWKTANWHEREAWDMFGIKFKGHPDLRRILMPADWEGHPLLKDYKQQEYYRGVKLD